MVFNNSNDPAHFPEVGTSQERATCAICHDKETFKIHACSIRQNIVNRQRLPTLSLQRGLCLQLQQHSDLALYHYLLDKGIHANAIFSNKILDAVNLALSTPWMRTLEDDVKDTRSPPPKLQLFNHIFLLIGRRCASVANE